MEVYFTADEISGLGAKTEEERSKEIIHTLNGVFMFKAFRELLVDYSMVSSYLLLVLTSSFTAGPFSSGSWWTSSRGPTGRSTSTASGTASSLTTSESSRRYYPPPRLFCFPALLSCVER